MDPTITTPSTKTRSEGIGGSQLFSVILAIAHNLLDLLNHSPRAQDPTGDTVGESDQSQGTDDHTHEIVERK